MKYNLHISIFIFIGLIMIALNCGKKQDSLKLKSKELLYNESKLTPKQKLGKKVFFDDNLSTPVGMSCASCHSPETAFVNPNYSIPVSQGVHKDRFGNRNDLTAAYASFIPNFHYDKEKKSYVGGLFWDGRAVDLIEQAKGPFLNPLEMSNPDINSIMEKIRNSDYTDLFKEVFGKNALENADEAYSKVAEAITEYEKSSELNQFNSKYDLYLKGKVELTEQEKRGLLIFENKGECISCHPNKPGSDESPPLFTDYTYDNLGLPKNPENPYYYLPKELNPEGIKFVDLGLGKTVKKKEENGKFRVPTLRNISKTAPYMHNGIFKNIRQVVVFYNTRDIGLWPKPEIPENINRKELGNLGLSEQEIDDIVAFLKTLDDNYIPKENK